MALTPLTLYGSTVADGTLTTANQLSTTTGGTAQNRNTLIGTATGYGELCSQGTSNPWPALSSIGAPTGNGWILNSILLDNQQIPTGIWQAIQRLQTSIGSIITDIHVRAFYLIGGVYTQIGADMVKSNQTVNTANNTFTLPASVLAVQNFAPGSHVYIDVWPNIITNLTGSGAATLKCFESNSASAGVANNMQITTPGYGPPPAQIVDSPYGFTVFSSTAGVSTKLPQILTDMQALQNAAPMAISLWLRWQINWNLIDPGANGDYTPGGAGTNLVLTGLDDVVAKCNAASISLLFCIQFPPGNSSTGTGYYTQLVVGAAPTTYLPDAAKTGQFARFLATRYNSGVKGTIQGLEIGNEDYDLAANSDAVRAQGGTYLGNSLNAAYPLIKAALPACIVGAGSILKQNIATAQNWLGLLYATGAWNNLDYLNLHFYKNGGSPPLGNPPDYVGNGWGFFQAWQTIVATAQLYGSKPVWVTECGYGIDVVDAVHQWQYLLQLLDAVRLSDDVTHLQWYTIGNNDVKSLTQHGQVDGQPETYQPAYYVLQNYIARYPQWVNSPQAYRSLPLVADPGVLPLSVPTPSTISLPLVAPEA